MVNGPSVFEPLKFYCTFLFLFFLFIYLLLFFEEISNTAAKIINFNDASIGFISVLLKAGWSGGAMVLGKLSMLGRPTNLD